MELDVDSSLLDEIEDPELRNVLARLQKDGYAVFKNDRINNRISRAAKSAGNFTRTEQFIIMSNSRRSDLNVVSINNNIFNIEKFMSSFWGDLIKELK